MPTQPSDCEREDRGEDAGFEEEDEREHSDASFAMDTHCRSDKDHDCRHEYQEHEARLDKHHETGGGETSDGE
jgi:U3 small nucleolar RNA-associated protein 14